MGEVVGRVIPISDLENARRRRLRQQAPVEALTIKISDPELAELILGLARDIEVPEEAIAGEPPDVLGEAATEIALGRAVSLLVMHYEELGKGRKGPYYANCNADEAERGKPDKAVLIPFLGPKLVLADLPKGVPAMPSEVVLPQ